MSLLPKITIITPTFRRAAVLERSIVSVIEQKYQNIEYIIIDGGSTDGTVDLLKKYDSSITKWVSEPDEGPMHAFLKGYAMATGDYIFFLPSDDYFEPGVLHSIGDILRTEKCDVLHGNFVYYDNVNGSNFLCKPWFVTNTDIYRNRYMWPSVYLCTFFVKKSIYDTFIYNVDAKYIYAGDFKMYQMLLDRNAVFTYFDKAITHMSSGGISDGAIQGYIQIAEIAIEHGCSRASALIHLVTKIISRSFSQLLIWLGLNRLRNMCLTNYYKNIVKLNT